MPHSRRRAPPAQGGYTLLELMIAVVIIGIISAIAIPAYVSYNHRSRTSEATQFLRMLRLRQESYRNEFGAYCNTGTDFTPRAAGSLDGSMVRWPHWTSHCPPVGSDCRTDCWCQLGANVDEEVRFSYRCQAGGAADDPPGGFGFDNDNHGHWYVCEAIGDLDEDGALVTFHAYSHAEDISSECGGSSPCAAGYD